MKEFLHSHSKACIGFSLYYALYISAAIIGTQMGYSFYVFIGSGLLLLVELLVTVGGSDTNHLANFRDHQQHPYAAQDLPHLDIKMAPSKFSVPFVLLLVAPPLLYFLFSFLLS